MAMRLNAEMKAQVVRRAMQYAETARAGGGEREKARRVKQMLEERLKAENGVERVFVTDFKALCPSCGELVREPGLCATCNELLDREEARE